MHGMTKRDSDDADILVGQEALVILPMLLRRWLGAHPLRAGVI